MKRDDIQAYQRTALHAPISAPRDEEQRHSVTPVMMQQCSRDKHGGNTCISVVKDHAAFDGMPVWRVCHERRNPITGSILPVPMWPSMLVSDVIDTLWDWLAGVGRPERTRSYRSNTQVCVDRSITSGEWEAFSVPFHDADPAPWVPYVQVLADNWQSRPAAYPCENPKRIGDPVAWIPQDCGHCDPCRDRATMETPRQKERRVRAEKAAASRVMVQTPEEE